MLFRYEIKNLKEAFPSLKPFDDLVCIPIFSSIVSGFLQDLASDPGKYGISGYDLISKFDGKKSLDDVYAVMSGALVIKVILRRTDIYVVNGGLTWYLPSSITFNARNVSNIAEGLYKKFADFVRRQDLEGAKKVASLALGKGRAKSLRPGIAEFYLEQN